MISTEFHKGLPVEYESFLIERYNSFITTCHYIKLYHPNLEINYMLVHANGILIDLLVFGNSKNTTTCFNSLTNLGQDIIDEFIKNIYIKFPSIQKIKIIASYKSYTLDKSVLYFRSDDHILNLPATIDEFYMELGAKTRKHIKARSARLSKEFSTVNFVVKFKTEIDENVVCKIIQLNRERMQHKGKKSGIDDAYKNNIYKFSQHYGCVAYLELDGTIVAGCISTILNKETFLHVIAHDNNFSKYNVGEVCAFNFIQTSIEKGFSTVHFLWGKSELKRRFLAKPSLLFSYIVFRKYSLAYAICKIKVALLNVLVYLKQNKISVIKGIQNILHRKGAQ